MPKQTDQAPINLVWLKRDLRTTDHAALAAAEAWRLPYLVVYLWEPDLYGYPDTSTRHLQFVYHSILGMDQQRLHAYGRKVDILHTDAVSAFGFLTERYRVEHCFSYQESGTRLSWQRDKQVRKLFGQRAVEWTEFQRDGIERGITDRDGWDTRWFKRMQQPLVENRFSQNTLRPLEHPFPLSEAMIEMLAAYPEHYQPAGETAAWQQLKSFTSGRGNNYHLNISRPVESRDSCTRLSPHLAWGNLSVRQAYQHIRQHPAYNAHKRAFSAACTRLKWHCHFIQKFEVECDYETVCVNRGYEQLERSTNSEHLEAWQSGQTGFPLVDACMRCLQVTGWVNFRMRAMLVSFLCHHLDQDWRNGVYHLARLFLDYEPGIHYTQFQMQAATTGINTVRIYNPVKQSKDNDPEGRFIRRWVPELAGVPDQFIPEPWMMDSFDQQTCGVTIGVDYPRPIVDHMASARSARSKIWGHRKNQQVRAERGRILQTHTRNRRAR